MEDIITNLAYFRSTVYIILLSMAIISAVRMFKKTPRFATGLIIALTGALVSIIMTNFVPGQNAKIASAILITGTMLVWAVLWVVDFADYEKD